MKWKLDDALLKEMARERISEIQGEREHLNKVIELTLMLMRTLVAMREAGGTEHQVSTVLSCAVALSKCRSEQEAMENLTELMRMEDSA